MVCKIMRRESIDVEAFTEAQRDYSYHRLFPLSNFETLDQKTKYIERKWPYAIGSIDRRRTLFKTNKGHVWAWPCINPAGGYCKLLLGHAIAHHPAAVER